MPNGLHRRDHERAGRNLRALVVLVLCIAFSHGALWPQPAHEAPAERLSQYQVEAAYLFDFAKFVRWPTKPGTADRPFAICVLGDDPFGPFLDRITAGEKIAGRPVVDLRISRPEQASACSILYISPSESGRLGRILPALKDTPVLTVSDISDFAERGGIIQFVLRDNRVRFVVNLAPVHSDGLALSSDLLKVALDVRGAEGSR